MQPSIEKVSAITLKIADMEKSVHFYQGVLGLEVLYGGPEAGFTSLRIPDADFPFINLQLGRQAVDWGRVIFYVSDVDAFWVHLKQNGFEPDRPQDAPWGERYFHMHDPDGHELSFARHYNIRTEGLSCLNCEARHMGEKRDRKRFRTLPSRTPTTGRSHLNAMQVR